MHVSRNMHFSRNCAIDLETVGLGLYWENCIHLTRRLHLDCMHCSGVYVIK